MSTVRSGCESGDDDTQSSHPDYLLTWLSSIGPVAGLTLDSAYASKLVS